ncbi:MAG: uroporphyrinogen-III C-methyltransferase [Deltaproteobacteria bacterium]|nr:uroporphyrinogen-III C-methyltransferase [Candidatus Tharpella sp.]
MTTNKKRFIRLALFEIKQNSDTASAILQSFRRLGVEIVFETVSGAVENPFDLLDGARKCDGLILPLVQGVEVLSTDVEWFVPRERREETLLPVEDDTSALFFKKDNQLLLSLRSFFVSSVAFVGGGPGDPGLCTVAGQEALRHCEVCLYDALVADSLLAEIPDSAKAVYVGKRCGHHSCGQPDICRWLADYARQGLRVVRLKGGDPGIFGRLAEEVETFDRYSLPYRVVPGVSSLLAATTGTGMFLTRRHISRGFTVLTPRHAQDGQDVDPVYGPYLKRPPRPVVFFMAMARIGELVENLKKRGRLATEPAAVVWGASTPSQEVVRGTLEDIEELVKNHDRELPGLFMVGETTVFSLTDKWSALLGERILLLCQISLRPQLEAEILAYGGKAVAPPPMLELEGVEVRKPDFDTVLILDEKIAADFSARWGEFDKESLRCGEDGRTMIRVLALERVSERLK